MLSKDLSAPNNEGVTPPHDANPPTPEELTEALPALMERIANARRDGTNSLAEHLADAYPKVAVMMGSLEHWLSGIQTLADKRQGVRINPRKRAATILRFLTGPDVPKDAVGIAEGARKPTWNRASRHANALLEMMAQGVAPENALDFLLYVKCTNALEQEWADRKRNGGNLSGAQPGTAVGATPDGRPILVKFGSTPEAGPMTTVRLPDDGGRIVVEIGGEAQPDAAKPKPDLPRGHMRVYLQGPVPSLKKLTQDLGGGRWAKTEDGERLFVLPDTEGEVAAGEAVSKGDTPVQKPTRPAAAPLPRPTVHSTAEEYAAWTASVQRLALTLASKAQQPKPARSTKPSPGRPALGTRLRPSIKRKA
jgi:hypothetical protein